MKHVKIAQIPGTCIMIEFTGHKIIPSGARGRPRKT